MGQLTETLAECVQRTQWTDRQRSISSNEFRTLHNNQRLDDYSGIYLANLRPQTPEPLIAALASDLRVLLARYIRTDTDRFGNGLAYLMGGRFDMREPKVPEFAETLVKPAAILGSERVAELLRSWEQGEAALHYEACVLLEGVNIDRPLEIPGLRLAKLPRSSADLPTSLPIHRGVTVDSYLGGVVLGIDYWVAPVFYTPPDGVPECSQDDLFTTSSQAPLNIYYDTFCESLSLACNHYVTWQSVWRNHHELQLFSDNVNTGAMYKTPTTPLSRKVSQEDLEMAMRIYRIRHKPGSDKPSSDKRGLDLAISRWVGSRRRRSHADRSIELRIALESLYLKQGGGELSFRVAMYGAWHLGTNHGERRAFFDTLRKQYNNASNAIHGGRIKDKKYKETLSSAQEICRRGILRRLEETTEPQWNNLVLGMGLEEDQ